MLVKVGFFGNFEKAFFGLTTEYLIDFVVFEKDKENQKIVNYCKENNVSYYYVKTIDEIKFLLDSHNQIDLFVVASFGLIFDKTIIKWPKFDTVNIHPGILPQYRGRHPLPQAILNKDDYMGLTAHIMNVEIDKGPILKISKLRINYKQNYKWNEKKLLDLLFNFVQESLKIYFSDRKIKIPEKGHYYKPLNGVTLNKIMNINQLKDL